MRSHSPPWPAAGVAVLEIEGGAEIGPGSGVGFRADTPEPRRGPLRTGHTPQCFGFRISGSEFRVLGFVVSGSEKVA